MDSLIECSLMGIVSDATLPPLLSFLSSVAKEADVAFSKHEMIFRPPLLSVSSLSSPSSELRYEQDLVESEYYLHYVGYPHIDQKTRVSVRPWLSSPVSGNAPRLLMLLRYTPEWEYVKRGVMFTRPPSRAEVLVYTVGRLRYSRGQSREEVMGDGNRIVEVRCVRPDAAKLQAIEEVTGMATLLAPFVELIRPDQRQLEALVRPVHAPL